MDEIEVIIKPDGSVETKVVQSKGDCHALTKSLEDALGKVDTSKEIPNPGQKQQDRLKH